MNGYSPSQIFKSEQRGCEETAIYKCLSTFNFNKYQKESRRSFGQLKFLNDESLSPCQSVTYAPEENTRVILLPLTGALNYSDNSNKRKEFIKSEQVKIMDIRKGLLYTFSNPYENEWINYLHIGFDLNSSGLENTSALHGIEFEKMNSLVPLGFKKLTGQSAGYVGIYRERAEENYALQDHRNGVFVYVINGVFDVQGRLLECRDGLSLWDTSKIEFEALTDNAIIILFEINLSSKHININ